VHFPAASGRALVHHSFMALTAFELVKAMSTHAGTVTHLISAE
jgi:hypothetical protein